ncbi:hypothetical protein [Paracidovorax anthurii]|uniref:Uncharacterized protein n=1 Tax=Paracidovorax anthurii TaxID=78229 RepID=A0A328YVJ4_9BURK|nr:hypothetical protein [Paracidovorax anthurii]RAR77988.1 hypothetical protein AX018_103326 [Paracidovorax anthurii]
MSRRQQIDQISIASSTHSGISVVSNTTHPMYTAAPPGDIEAPPPGDTQPPEPPTWGDTFKAMRATLGQRSATYFGAHAGAWLLQTASVAILAGSRNGDVSREAIANLSNLVGGSSSAVLKEAIGETMKTMPRLGDAILLPSETVLQREGPRVMAGFNDMWTAIAAAMTNVAVNAELRPLVEKSLTDRGVSPELALPISMMVSALAQRAISATADTVSDLTSTLVKSFLPGATAGNVVNEQIDKQTMMGGITARGLLNFGLTLPLGPLITLRKVMSGNDNDYQRSAASNAMAWTSLNGWIVAKAHLSALYKSLSKPAEAPPAGGDVELAPQHATQAQPHIHLDPVTEQDETNSAESSEHGNERKT